MCQSLFFNKETLTKVFPCEFCETSNNASFTEHLRATASYHFAERGMLSLRKMLLCFDS